MVNFPSELLEGIRLKLENEKKLLAERINDLTAQDPFTNPDRLNDNAASDMDASEESNHDRVIAVIEELKMKLSEVTGALIRIGDGTYGYCTNCGNMIEAQRLRVLPTATLCLKCEHDRKKSF